MGMDVPDYVSANVSDNRRNYTTNAFQKSSAIFTATYDIEGTYNAYEKDIAIVSFFFEYPTVFEYTRFGWILNYPMSTIDYILQIIPGRPE